MQKSRPVRGIEMENDIVLFMMCNLQKSYRLGETHKQEISQILRHKKGAGRPLALRKRKQRATRDRKEEWMRKCLRSQTSGNIVARGGNIGLKARSFPDNNSTIPLFKDCMNTDILSSGMLHSCLFFLISE